MNVKAAAPILGLLLFATSSSLRAQSAPSLDRFDTETRQSLELTCLYSKTEGPAVYSACLNSHIEALRTSPPVPDLSKLDDVTRRTFQQACTLEKRRGPALYARCLNAKITEARRSSDAPSLPDLTSLPTVTRSAIQQACILEKTQGPAAYAGCVRKELEKMGMAPDDVSSGTRTGRAQAYSALKWSGVKKPEMPSKTRSGASAPDALFAVLEKSVYVLISAPNIESARTGGGGTRQGSAVAISASVALTNCHVLLGNRVHFLVKEPLKDPLVSDPLKDPLVLAATLAYGDSASDRCALEVKSGGLVPIQGIRRYSTLVVGERVYSVGSPRGLENTLAEGILSGLRKEAGLDLVQTSAPISPGSSGGGLFDAAGNLIGITTFGRGQIGNLNFAIAADAYWR